MKKKYSIILILLGLSFTIINIIVKNISSSYPISLQYPLSDKIIVIDPGHGGADPGKVGIYGEDEQGINLEIAQMLKRLLNSIGAEVVMTRENSEGLYSENSNSMVWIKSHDMLKRRQIIEKSNGDIMISIHMNSFPDQRCFGAQTFYLKGDENSEKLGKILQEELVKISFKNNHREAKENDTYFILKNDGMPSVVVECGFLSNIEEEQMLNNSEYQEQIAWAILKAIVRYFY